MNLKDDILTNISWKSEFYLDVHTIKFWERLEIIQIFVQDIYIVNIYCFGLYWLGNGMWYLKFLLFLPDHSLFLFQMLVKCVQMEFYIHVFQVYMY